VYISVFKWRIFWKYPVFGVERANKNVYLSIFVKYELIG